MRSKYHVLWRPCTPALENFVVWCGLAFVSLKKCRGGHPHYHRLCRNFAFWAADGFALSSFRSPISVMSAHTQHPEIQQNYVRCFCLIFNISHPGNCGSMSFYRNKYSTACRLRKNCSVGKGFLSSLHQQERVYRTVHGLVSLPVPLSQQPLAYCRLSCLKRLLKENVLSLC